MEEDQRYGKRKPRYESSSRDFPKTGHCIRFQMLFLIEKLKMCMKSKERKALLVFFWCFVQTSLFFPPFSLQTLNELLILFCALLPPSPFRNLLFSSRRSPPFHIPWGLLFSPGNPFGWREDQKRGSLPLSPPPSRSPTNPPPRKLT